MSRKRRQQSCDRSLFLERLETRALLATFAETPQIFAPAKDAHLSAAASVDAEELTVRAEGAATTAYIAFFQGGFGGQPIQSARLRLQAARDAALAEIAVHRGGAERWNERELSETTAPTRLEMLDQATGPFTAGDWVELDVTNAILGSGFVNFVLTSETGEAVFWSREGAGAPELVIVSESAALPGDFNGDQQTDGNDVLWWQRVDADAETLTQWTSRFGATAATPEPANVTSYGATPNDGESDAASIQTALNNHASVYLPAGDYVLDAPLVISHGRRLFGPSNGDPARLRIAHDSGAPNAGNYALHVIGNGVTIADLAIDKDFVDGSYGVGIHAERADNLFISGVEIQDYSVRYGIHILESDEFEIDDVFIHDFMTNVGGSDAPDMILDSPAGIRVTRSTIGAIRNSKVHNIEVGADARASVSEFVPSYGPQGYQSDAITISDSSGVYVESNNLFNSGELVDVLVSDGSVVRDNTMQMAYLIGVKVIGSQESIVTDNYVGDAAIGLWMGDHSSGEQATGNQIYSNNFVNNGSPGIWDAPAAIRIPFSISGVYVDPSADLNSVTGNQIYDYYDYLTAPVVRNGSSNVFADNDEISDEFSPPSNSDVEILGEWTAGLTHARELLALNRALVLFAFAEDADKGATAETVAYGGQSLTKLGDRLVVGAESSVYVSAWILLQDAINRSSHDQFDVTWSAPPEDVSYASVWLSNVYQPAPVASEDSGAATSGDTVFSSPRDAEEGGILLYGAVAASPGEFTPNNGLMEALELQMNGADATVGYQRTVDGTEFSSVTHTDLGFGAIEAIHFRPNQSARSESATIDVSTLGALPDDGVNDAVILQNVLNGAIYDDIYLPPGAYHVDRPLFVRSNTTVRGGVGGTSRIETLSDATVFRIDDRTRNVTISNLSIERPQTQDSDNEIIRSDRSSWITIDSVDISSSASRAPMINFMGGSQNAVVNTTISDYQVVRAEPSPEKAGLHLQVFGVGINFVDNLNAKVINNRVIQQTPLPIDLNAAQIKGVHQSSAIQVINSTGAAVAENYILNTGQGMDLGGSSQVYASDNFIDEIHSAGIKLVNGSNNNTIEDNYIRNSGLTGIWVSAGVAGLGGSFENVVRNNTLVGIGKGFGRDFWDQNFALSTPAAIHLQAAQIETDRARRNIIVDNTSYYNDQQRGIVVSEPANSGSPFPALDNQISNNIESADEAPAPWQS